RGLPCLPDMAAAGCRLVLPALRGLPPASTGIPALERQAGPVHEAVVVALDQKRRGVGDGVEQRVEPFAVGPGEIAEHMRRYHFLDAGMADADTDAAIVLAAMGVERPDAVMAAGAAAGLDAHLAGRKVEFVIEDGDVAG